MKSKWQERHKKMYGYYNPYNDHSIKHDITVDILIKFLIGVQVVCFGGILCILGSAISSSHKLSEGEQNKPIQIYSEAQNRRQNAQSNIQE